MDTFEKLWAAVDLEKVILNFRDSSVAAMAVTDLNGIILWCNDRLADIYEEPKSVLIGSHLGDRVIYPKGVNVETRIGQAIEKGYSELLKTRWMTHSGEEKFMHQRIYRLDDRSGTHIGFWGIAYELTEEKRTINDSKAALRLLHEMREEEIKDKQLEVIEMLKAQSEALCPGKALREDFCPAILAVEESIIKDRPSLNALLTSTELKVAAYVKQGMSIKTIAHKMCVSERTVKNHRHAIRKKLNITRTNIALAKFLQGFPL